MPRWLLSRLFETEDQPKLRFAFQGTVNWMRALSIEVSSHRFENAGIRQFYSHVARRSTSHAADTRTFERLFMAFNHTSGLSAISNDIDNPYDGCRSAIIAWYYGIYFAASAMVAATSIVAQETHAATANAWQTHLVENDLVMRPFSLFVPSLILAESDAQVAAYRGPNGFDLNSEPTNEVQAWGALVSYLKGTCEYERWRIEERVRRAPDFIALSVDNFRTKAARELRDGFLRNGQVNFLVQAIRYRGKANYRDSLFLSYGDDRADQIDRFLVDLKDVAVAFLRMACGYCAQRVELGTWEQFVDDVELNSRLSLDAGLMRGLS